MLYGIGGHRRRDSTGGITTKQIKERTALDILNYFRPGCLLSGGRPGVPKIYPKTLPVSSNPAMLSSCVFLAQFYPSPLCFEVSMHCRCRWPSLLWRPKQPGPRWAARWSRVLGTAYTRHWQPRSRRSVGGQITYRVTYHWTQKVLSIALLLTSPSSCLGVLWLRGSGVEHCGFNYHQKQPLRNRSFGPLHAWRPNL